VIPATNPRLQSNPVTRVHMHLSLSVIRDLLQGKNQILYNLKQSAIPPCKSPRYACNKSLQQPLLCCRIAGIITGRSTPVTTSHSTCRRETRALYAGENGRSPWRTSRSAGSPPGAVAWLSGPAWIPAGSASRSRMWPPSWRVNPVQSPSSRPVNPCGWPGSLDPGRRKTSGSILSSPLCRPHR